MVFPTVGSFGYSFIGGSGERWDGRVESRAMTEVEDTGRDTLPLEEVRRLVDLLKESGVGEIQVRDGDFEVRVKAAEAPVVSTTPISQEREVIVEAPPPEEALHAVRSPLVGTFFRAPGPGEDSYVEVGDKVVAGQTLCIVEAMKLMNEIPADVSGEVVEVLAENQGGVQYDQPLFHLRPEE